MNNGASTVTSTYNADNELTSSTDGKSYTYDANGNMLSATLGAFTSHYTYNAARDMSPVLTTRVLSTTQTTSSCSTGGGCSTTLRMPTMTPSPQTGSVSIHGYVYETDQVDTYPNCPTRTVIWYDYLNGVGTELGTETLSLNHAKGCFAAFSETYTPTLTLHTGDTLYEWIDFLNDTTDPATYSVSVSTFGLGVPPYVGLEYGPDGLRSAETVNTGTTTHFGYDLLGMGGLPEEVADYIGTVKTTSYVYGVGSDRPLEILQGDPASYAYHRDGLGSTTTLTDAAGDVVASYAYDAYGNPRQAADTIGNPLRYTGLPWDPTTSLIYARARFRDPFRRPYF